MKHYAVLYSTMQYSHVSPPPIGEIRPPSVRGELDRGGEFGLRRAPDGDALRSSLGKVTETATFRIWSRSEAGTTELTAPLRQPL